MSSSEKEIVGLLPTTAKKICKCIYRALHSEQDTPTTKVAYFFLYVAQHNKSVSVVQTMHLTRNLGNNHKIG